MVQNFANFLEEVLGKTHEVENTGYRNQIVHKRKIPRNNNAGNI